MYIYTHKQYKYIYIYKLSQIWLWVNIFIHIIVCYKIVNMYTCWLIANHACIHKCMFVHLYASLSFFIYISLNVCIYTHIHKQHVFGMTCVFRCVTIMNLNYGRCARTCICLKICMFVVCEVTCHEFWCSGRWCCWWGCRCVVAGVDVGVEVEWVLFVAVVAVLLYW